MDLIAAQIRNSAIGSKRSFSCSTPISKGHYFIQTELNEEIPSGLFLAVAQILAYVFQLKAATENNSEKPIAPKNIEIPKDFKT